MQQHLRDILRKDPVRGVNLACFAARYGVASSVVVGESVLVRGTSDHTWVYLLPADEAGARSLLDSLTAEDHYLVGFDAWMLDLVRERFRPEWTLCCRKLAWPGDLTPAAPAHPIRPLALADAAYLFDHSDYKTYTDIPYIEDQIQHGIGGGIAGPDGRLAAWALTHDDGAIGFLHVLEPFRKLGYGASLTRWMVQRVRERGGIPFVHIEPKNERSLSLAHKMGFQPCGEVWWVKGELRAPQNSAARGVLG
ncbi:MAG TPA: GNAT family N-acetyltransferase [Holophaga sp.]|nr:GNAT family N-acetyltransferase [Holophaga sp.]